MNISVDQIVAEEPNGAHDAAKVAEESALKKAAG
jgi:hypothetical protein